MKKLLLLIFPFILLACNNTDQELEEDKDFLAKKEIKSFCELNNIELKSYLSSYKTINKPLNFFTEMKSEENDTTKLKYEIIYDDLELYTENNSLYVIDGYIQTNNNKEYRTITLYQNSNYKTFFAHYSENIAHPQF